MNIGYKLIKNCMAATAEKAPYLGMAIPAGSLAYDNILREMIKSGTKMTQPTAKYFLDALYEFAAEKIAAEQVRINIGAVSIYPMIDGSFDAEDAAFDPKRNSLYVGASLSQELRDRVAGIAPDFAGDASAGTVKLHSCMDLETQVFKAIRGTRSFRLAGANLTVPDGADESLGLYAKNGVDKVADIVVSETDGGQQITCHLSDAAAVPKGTYKVRLASHGLDPTDPLTVATLTVTLAEAVPPPPDPVRFDTLKIARNEHGVITRLTGTNLDAIVDYGYESTGGQFNVDVYVNGANRGRANYAENLDGIFQANLNEFELQVGDTVKLEAAINPASGFSQEKVEGTTTVVEE